MFRSCNRYVNAFTHLPFGCASEHEVRCTRFEIHEIDPLAAAQMIRETLLIVQSFETKLLHVLPNNLVGDIRNDEVKVERQPRPPERLKCKPAAECEANVFALKEWNEFA